MSDRLKVKFLVVIWGARYIEEFARIALPSLLASGNLPHLAAETDLEILIMTAGESRSDFDQEPAFVRLKSLAPVRFILIDDLITTGVYGVTLTLAYARGIGECGADQTKTCFVFMNSDFVLSDSSLRALVARLKNGERCILAPSLRVRSESVVPQLAQAIESGDGVLRMPPREMVQLAFENLHPTVIAKTVTQELVTCANHNQIYWQVDQTTLLARHHLIFMLAIRPEVPMGYVNSYCDYGFVPELVPSGQFSILSDSDDFFMMELQSAEQEKNLLRGGASTASQIAAELSIWTTREHRRFAETDIVFHTGELSFAVPGARDAFARYIASLCSRMSANAASHIDHYYWVMGVQAWASMKHGEVREKLPPELGDQRVIGFTDELPDTPVNIGLPTRIRQRLSQFYLGFLGKMRARAGHPPEVAIWRHQWLDCRHVLNWKESVETRPGARNLVICDASDPLGSYFERLPNFDVDIEEEWGDLDGPRLAPQHMNEERYDNILLHMYRANMRTTKAVIELAERRLKDDGTIAVFVEHPGGENDPTNFSYELAQYVEEVFPSNWIGYRISVRYAGGLWKRRLRLLEQRLIAHLWPTSLWRLPYLAVAVMLWPVIAMLTAINNFNQRDLHQSCPSFCSSFLLTFGRAGTRPMTEAPGGESLQPRN